jgi:hypothetical protein
MQSALPMPTVSRNAPTVAINSAAIVSILTSWQKAFFK